MRALSVGKIGAGTGKGAERLRNITLEDYGLSDERYRELKHFCLQYREKQKAAKQGSYGALHSVDYSRVRGSGGIPGSPTESEAIRNVTRQEHARQDCQRIEEAARWAAAAGSYPDGWEAVLLSVTDNIGFDYLLARFDFIPWNRTDFYAVRRAFFYWLDELQHKGRE